VTEEEFEQEVSFYRQAIVEAVASVDLRFIWKNQVPELSARFEALSRDDRTHFRQLCVRLLEDDQREVRLGAMKLLGACKIKDNILSMLLITIAFQQKDLREEALSALWHVATRRVLPQLLLFAEKGYSSPLHLALRMLQTPEEIERGIAIARKYLGANDYDLREGALFLLQKYSTMDQEAERVLVAVQKYKDELFIDALKKAPPEVVLEPLKALRSTIGENYAEYGDLSSTIAVLEQKSSNEEN
jgi:hypothetical protein